MLTPTKKRKLLVNLRAYHKKYLHAGDFELDESGTRLMVNEFLTDVLGYAPISEVKTEFMIKGMYADYVIQINKSREFLVEVKRLSFDLLEKHLRQAIMYGANEGIEWALLTNGRQFDLYKISFNKPFKSSRVFSVSLADRSGLKQASDVIQYLHKDSVTKKGLQFLWNQCRALDPSNVAGLLYSPIITNFLKRTLKSKYKVRFSEKEIHASIDKVISDPISLDEVRQAKGPKAKVTIKNKAQSGPGPA